MKLSAAGRSPWAAALVLLPMLSALACAHVGRSRPDFGATATLEEARCLFKIRAREGDRDGRFRLALWEDASGFRLAASDALGRGLWIYDQQGDSGLWVDRRHESVCRLQGEVALEVEAFGSVAVDAIPALLRGRYEQVPADLVPEPFEDGVRLDRGQSSLAWNRGHCEPSGGVRPPLDRYLDWPENCAVDSGSGE